MISVAGLRRKYGSLDANTEVSIEHLAKLIEAGRLAELRQLLPQMALGRLNQHDAHGFTLAHHACAEGRAEALQLLLERGIDADVPNVDGETPLHLAVSVGYLDCTQLLLASRAVVTKRTNAGKTALSLATTMGHDHLVSLLSASGGGDMEEPAARATDGSSGRGRVRTPDADEPRDLAYALLEAEYDSLNDASLGELRTVLEMCIEKIDGAAQRRRAAEVEAANGAALPPTGTA